jgi:hypothetical protein
MAAISRTFAEGGANLVPGAGTPSITDALRDIADDLSGVRGATVTAPALAAFTDPPAAAEMALLRTLVNELRAAQVTRFGTTLLTTKV